MRTSAGRVVLFSASPRLRGETVSAVGLLVLVLSASGCSVKKYAINQVGDILSSNGSIYATDEDIEFVGDALPFSLKLVESLIDESPRHRGLLRTAARGFTVYSYAYVDYEAELAADESLDRARALRERAERFYMRAHRYAVRGLDRSTLPYVVILLAAVLLIT